MRPSYSGARITANGLRGWKPLAVFGSLLGQHAPSCDSRQSERNSTVFPRPEERGLAVIFEKKEPARQKRRTNRRESSGAALKVLL
jgi:hypothetical protein